MYHWIIYYTVSFRAYLLLKRIFAHLIFMQYCRKGYSNKINKLKVHITYYIKLYLFAMKFSQRGQTGNSYVLGIQLSLPTHIIYDMYFRKRILSFLDKKYHKTRLYRLLPWYPWKRDSIIDLYLLTEKGDETIYHKWLCPLI